MVVILLTLNFSFKESKTRVFPNTVTSDIIYYNLPWSTEAFQVRKPTLLPIQQRAQNQGINSHTRQLFLSETGIHDVICCDKIGPTAKIDFMLFQLGTVRFIVIGLLA
jgi:hypothetical protein